MVSETPTSFYVDGTVYDEADVVTNDHQSSAQASVAPSSFFTDGGLVGAEDVTNSDVAPSGTPTTMPSSFFTDGGLVGAETVTNNDNVPDSSPSPAPTSFYPDGNLYDYLSQESEVVALLRQLADTTTTNANAAASSATNSATSASNAATSAAQAATVVQSAAGTATPLMDGTAAVGASTHWAHEDHVHPTDTSRASVSYVDTQDATQLASGKAYTDTQVAPKADKSYVDTQDATKANTTYVDTQDTSGLNSAKAYTDTSVAPKANKTYVDTQDTALLNGMYGGQCKFIYASATTCKLIPFNGNKIKLNGKIYTIPAAGITFTNAGLAANTLYYAYVSDSGGSLAPSLGTGGYAISSTVGNEGVATSSTTDTLSLVGMVYVNASGQFADTGGYRFVRSWFNDFGSVAFGSSGTTVSTGSTSWIELDVAVRAMMLLWKGEHVSYNGFVVYNNNTAGQTIYAIAWMNGAASGGYSFQQTTSWQSGAICAFMVAAADGINTFSVGGQVAGGTGYWSNKVCTVTSVRR